MKNTDVKRLFGPSILEGGDMAYIHAVEYLWRMVLRRLQQWMKDMSVPGGRRAYIMPNCLDEIKAAQITARFIKKQNGTDTQNYTKTMKLLYLVEREAMKRWNVSLMGDALCWMDRGPVLSGVYDRIKGKPVFGGTQWEKWFTTRGYNLALLDDPGEDHLAEPILNLIDTLHERYKDVGWEKTVDIVHRICHGEQPGEPNGTSLPIDREVIFRNVGKGTRAGRLARKIERSSYIKSTIGCK